MSDVLIWVLVHLPWYVDAAVLALIIGAVAWYIPPLRHYVWEAALGALLIVGAAALAQKGYAKKSAEDMAAANKALDRAADARRKQQELDADAKNLRKPDNDMRRD